MGRITDNVFLAGLISFALAALLICLTSCATTNPNPTPIAAPQGASINLPKFPSMVEIAREGMPKDPTTHYLEEPKRLAPNEKWTAYPDGAWVWKNRDLNGILYALEQYPSWMKRTQTIVKQHNEKMGLIDDKLSPKDRQWWQIWR